ncbi:Hypothetical protein HVR_LOCUS38 [uncultured virus]|nr:Hypothetical protein HVR_LOCUS38 [uncultured virus]
MIEIINDDIHDIDFIHSAHKSRANIVGIKDERCRSVSKSRCEQNLHCDSGVDGALCLVVEENNKFQDQPTTLAQTNNLSQNCNSSRISTEIKTSISAQNDPTTTNHLSSRPISNRVTSFAGKHISSDQELTESKFSDSNHRTTQNKALKQSARSIDRHLSTNNIGTSFVEKSTTRSADLSNKISSRMNQTSYSPRLNDDYLLEPSNRDFRGSQMVTFGKMSNGMEFFGKALIRSFGGAISQRIASLMQRRNEIIRDYYRLMRPIKARTTTLLLNQSRIQPLYDECLNFNTSINDEIAEPSDHETKMCNGTSNEQTEINNSDENEFTNGIILEPNEIDSSKEIITGTFATEYKSSDKDSSLFPKLDPFKVPVHDNTNISVSDIITLTLRKLEVVTREITDSIASSFHIRDVNQGTNVKRPITHYQRLFNLITMYDKELINQAKAYATHQYGISMNCAQSSLEITHHISDELNILMKDTYRKLQTI